MSYGRSPAQLPQLVIQQGTRGIETSAVWVDEMTNPSVDAFAHATRRDTDRSSFQQVSKRIVDPLEITCGRCKAAAGERCTDTNRRRTFERKPHRKRKDDARLATEALRALDPR